MAFQELALPCRAHSDKFVRGPCKVAPKTPLTSISIDSGLAVLVRRTEYVCFATRVGISIQPHDTLPNAPSGLGNKPFQRPGMQ